MSSSQLSDYIPLESIGEGSFGKVCLIKRKVDDRKFVWKEINYGDMMEKEKELLVSEITILKSFQNHFIVKYYDRIVDKASKKLYIIMEYCPFGDLAALIRDRKQNKKASFDEDFIWKIAAQMCLALQECHYRKEGKIIHRDIKPANIFIYNHMNGFTHAKLGDFGLARILSELSKYAHTNVGTPYYMSPEQINDKQYNEKSDLWSLGCVLYELATLHAPFEANNHLALALKIKGGNYTPIDETKYSADLRSLIKNLLTTDPEKRPGVNNLLTNRSISLSVKEAKLYLNGLILKKKEDELARKEKQLTDKEQDLYKKETELKLRELDISKKEQSVGILPRVHSLNILPSQKEGLQLGDVNTSNKENIFKNFKVV